MSWHPHLRLEIQAEFNRLSRFDLETEHMQGFWARRLAFVRAHRRAEFLRLRRDEEAYAAFLTNAAARKRLNRGKVWEATHPPVTCLGCKIIFQPPMPDRGFPSPYCSKPCRRRAKYLGWRDRNRPVVSRTCPACSATFTPARSDARYCSNRCRRRGAS